MQVFVARADTVVFSLSCTMWSLSRLNALLHSSTLFDYEVFPRVLGFNVHFIFIPESERF